MTDTPEGEVIQTLKRNVQHASTEQLKREWDLWADCNGGERMSLEKWKAQPLPFNAGDKPTQVGLD